MKAITVLQPWATLLVTGKKHIETRSWKTNYRGEILIHAGKKDPLFGFCMMTELRKRSRYQSIQKRQRIISALSMVRAEIKGGRE